MSSDVFGALLRAAGPLSAPRMSEPADPFELGIESSEAVVTAPLAQFDHPSPAPRQGAASASMLDDDDAVPISEASVTETAASAGATPAVPTPLPLALLPASDGVIHPAVQAALRWVRADPLVVESVVVSPPQPAAVPQSQGVLARHSAATPVRRELPMQHAQPWLATSDPTPHGAELDAAPAAPGLRRIERDGRVAAAPLLDRVDRSAPTGDGGVEVSIGSIHVTIEAPPAPPSAAPPATAAALTPPQRQPGATRTAARSGFARSRLPRL